MMTTTSADANNNIIDIDEESPPITTTRQHLQQNNNNDVNDHANHRRTRTRTTRYFILLFIIIISLTVIIIGTLVWKFTKDDADDNNNNFGTTNNNNNNDLIDEDDDNNNNDDAVVAPSFYPSTSYVLSYPPSLMLSTNPSSSYTPTYSPTSCIDKISLNKQLLDLPSSSSSMSVQQQDVVYSINGNDIMILSHDANLIYVSFFHYNTNNDNHEWTRSDVYTFQYTSNLYDHATIDISNYNALLGLPMYDDGAGIVYVFEKLMMSSNDDDDNSTATTTIINDDETNNNSRWYILEEPITPNDAWPNDQFGHSVVLVNNAKNDRDQDRHEEEGVLAVITAHGDKAIYIFQKQTNKEEEEETTRKWIQLSKLDLEYKPHSIHLVANGGGEIGTTTSTILVVNTDDDDDNVGDTTTGSGGGGGSINFYQYDIITNRFDVLQDPILINNPNNNLMIMEEEKEEDDGGIIDTSLSSSQIIGTGSSRMRMLSSIDATADDNTFAYSTLYWDDNDDEWIFEGVYIYNNKRSSSSSANDDDDDDDVFTLHQFLNATLYNTKNNNKDNNFTKQDVAGIHIALDNDILLVGRSVFTKQHHGYFEESFVLTDVYKKPQLSRRHILGLISSPNDTVAVLNLDDCMPTPTMASTSTPIGSSSSDSSGSSNGPITISQSPTISSSLVPPSSAPSSSIIPSTTLIPSIHPTSSSAPTLCYNVKVVIMTTGANPESIDNVTSWQLNEGRDDNSNTVVLQDDVYANQVKEYVAECLKENEYVFSITNNNGNGFVGFGEEEEEECTTCGYFLFVNGISIGGSINYYYEDRLVFPLPLPQSIDNNGNVVEDDDGAFCSGDFFLRIETDNNPEEITWILKNVKGDTVLTGERNETLYLGVI